MVDLPETAYLLMNGSVITPSYPYLMDCDGNMYAYISELDAAVLSENVFACDDRGEPVAFSLSEARWISVISMESALEQLSIE